MDEGTERVTDANERAALREQSSAVQRRSLLTAVVLTAVAMALPTM